MNLYFKPEWRVPALVGAVSFSAGVGVGILGLTAKQRRDSRIYRESDWHSGVVDEANMMGMHVVDKQQMALDFVNASKADTDQATYCLFNDGVLVIPEEEDVTELIDEVEEAEKLGADLPRVHELIETSVRPKEGPYVISADDFHSNKLGYKQGSLEYFADDDVLCDDRRVPIYGFTEIVGPLPFGFGSGDSDVVYIRNEALKGEWEVTRVETSYQAEVLGIQFEEDAEADELKHSQPLRRFRDY